MATAEELRAQIAAAEEGLRQDRQTEVALDSRFGQACERFKLRKKLQEVNALRARQRQSNQGLRTLIAKTDLEEPVTAEDAKAIVQKVSPHFFVEEETASCNDGLVKGAFVWKIAGMSWMKHALKHSQNDKYALSDKILNLGRDDERDDGDEEFDFVYHPSRAGISSCSEEASDGGCTHCASLAIRCLSDTSSTFRYKIFVQRNDGEFVQWGLQGEFCDVAKNQSTMLFGPDVQPMPGPALGIFGLSHEDLLRSEWVREDTLVAKFEIELLPAHGSDTLPQVPIMIDIPPPSLSSNFLSLLEEGKHCDVTFKVKGEPIKAHACVLAARSEVFDRELHSGMRESKSREVFIEDCEAHIFWAMLQFLYSDDFLHIEKSMKTGAASSREAGGGDAAESSPASKVRYLQDVLFVSHKYQISRLSAWCQRQLCDLVSATEVCSLLQQAHLLDATVLQEVCLKYIKSNMEKVVSTSEFAKVTSEWPELLLKIGLSASGVSPSTAASAVAAQQSFLRKRKRE
mmetsp:Transcript_64032/g.111557  ORF Transcript_64032/g.111557 Transcript_64032/m.111557 type:complete len:515 (-) Transcript_64032:160-1704(-)